MDADGALNVAGSPSNQALQVNGRASSTVSTRYSSRRRYWSTSNCNRPTAENRHYPRLSQEIRRSAFHHVAVRVEDIDKAVERLKRTGVVFAGNIVGNPGNHLRQVCSAPEMINGQPFSVLDLAERHRGYLGFLPPQADSLMKSTAPR